MFLFCVSLFFFHFQYFIQCVAVWVFIASEVSFHLGQRSSHRIIRVQNSSFIIKITFPQYS